MLKYSNHMSLLVVILLFSCFSYAEEKSMDSLIFWKLNRKDSFEVVLEKVKQYSSELSIKESNNGLSEKYSAHSAIVVFPRNQMLEEKSNLNFLLWYYSDRIISFSKYEIKNDELNKTELTFNKMNAKQRIEGKYKILSVIKDDLSFELWIDAKKNNGIFKFNDLSFFDQRGVN